MPRSTDSRLLRILAAALILTATACAADDTEPDPDARASGGDAAADLGAGVDLAALGPCASWSGWKPSGLSGFVCAYACDKYQLKCNVGPKGGSCTCSIEDSQGRYGGGSYSFCPTPSTGDPEDCRRSLATGCCLKLSP